MIAEQRKKCSAGGCHEEYYALGFGQSPFHVPPPLVSALQDNASQGHYSAAEGIPELRSAISGFNKRHFGLDVDPDRIVIGPGNKRSSQYSCGHDKRRSYSSIPLMDRL